MTDTTQPHDPAGEPGTDTTAASPPRLGLAYGILDVIAHKPSWAATAAAHRNVVAAALPELVTAVEHVGSTAIAGMPARPILDLAVRLAPGADPSTVIDRLACAGYLFRGDKGSCGGLLFVYEPEPKMRSAHLHVLAEGDPQWDRYLAARDRLTRDPALAARYADIKTGLAQRHPGDRAAYTAAKEAFLTELLHDLPAPTTARPVVQRVRALLITSAGKLLVIRHTKPGQPVYWEIPGGGIEPSDSSIEDAILREVAEETGGQAHLHRLVHIATVAGASHATFLGRIPHWDPELRSGPELADPARGSYDLEELDLDPATLADGRLWPVPTAAWLANLLRDGHDPYDAPDLRDGATVEWEPRRNEHRRDELPEPETP